MAFLNVEFKARCSEPERVRAELHILDAEFRGEDCQTDTYFRVPRGRLKLREGIIENALIQYERPDTPDFKRCEFRLFPTKPDSPLKALLTTALGVLVVVDKRREIYFLGNVKIHLDSVRGLGTFVEVEARESDGTSDEARLREQCRSLAERFGIRDADLVSVSYSDLLLRKERSDGI